VCTVPLKDLGNLPTQPHTDNWGFTFYRILFPLDNSPRKPSKMRRRPSQPIDVERANSSPPKRKPTNSDTKTYVDHVATLRGKGQATEALVHYQETGKALGKGLGVEKRKDKQKLARPRRRDPEAVSDDHTDMFEQDLSGVFPGHIMGVYTPQHAQMAQKVNVSERFVKSPKQALFKAES
jgi:hypothetical protein